MSDHPHDFDEEDSVGWDPDSLLWPNPVPCRDLDPQEIVEPDDTLHPYVTPSIFETPNGTP